ncbi:glycine/sarcosine/betaine reductase component B subunit [Chloroflexota bacterium]
MSLELDILNIQDVQFAEETVVRDHILYINYQELRELLQQDKRVSKVEIELAHPGENCRILQVADVIEPRAKTGGDSEDFPGVLSKQGTAGRGNTCVLHGVAVVISNQSGACDIAESDMGEDQMGEIVDMSGPGAEVSQYGKTNNVVVLPYPADDVTLDDYRIALKIAGLKTAVYLAKAGKDLKPDEVERYDLPPLTEVTKGMENLPKVAYIFQVYCTSFPAMAGEPILYGDNIRKLVPTIINPNEVLDGAIINPYHNIRGCETYIIQNHPVIKELYRQHGENLCFVGVIVTVSQYTEPERERSAFIASNLAKSVLGADGVIITKSSGGAPDVDVAQTAQRCEELGVKTVLLMWDVASGSGVESGIVFNFPKANTIVNTGNEWLSVSLPAVERVIGRPVILSSGVSSDGTLEKVLNWIVGAVDLLGRSKITSIRY